MQLRRATPADRTDVETVTVAAYTPWIARVGRLPGPMTDDVAASIAAGYVHVLEDENRVRGVLVAFARADALMLHSVAIHPASQGRGFGRALIAGAEAMARAAGLGAVELATNEAMAENIAFYGRLGFAETRRGIEHGFRRVFMRKALPRFRRAEARDADLVGRISAAAYVPAYLPVIGVAPAPAHEDYAPWIARGETWLAAIAHGAEAGVLVADPRTDHLLVHSLAVAPPFQRRGLGASLLALAVERARASGRPAVRLHINRRMTRNLLLYARAGFVVTGERPHPGRPGEVLVDLSRTVSTAGADRAGNARRLADDDLGAIVT